MKYEELINEVDKLEEEAELTECIYFGAIKKLKNIQNDLTIIDDVKHIRKVIKPFLIQWGMMSRVVGRVGLDWKNLGTTLRGLEKEYGALRDYKFMEINFSNEDVSRNIKCIYIKGKIDSIYWRLHLRHKNITFTQS